MPVTSSQRSGGDHGLMQCTPHVAPHCAAAAAWMSAPVVLFGSLLGPPNQSLEVPTFMRLTKNCCVVLFVTTSTRCEVPSSDGVIEICPSGIVTYCCAPMASDLCAWPTSRTRSLTAASVGTTELQYMAAPAIAPA